MSKNNIKNFKLGKRVVSLLLTSALAMSFSSCSKEISSSNVSGYIMQGDMVKAKTSVNMRTDDGLHGDIICVIQENEEFKRILSAEENWDLVIFKDRIGFVYGDYIEEVRDLPNNLQIEKKEGTILANTNVNLRLGPSIEDKSINGIGANEYATVIGVTNNNWYLVSYNGQIGYVLGDFVSYEEKEEKTHDPNYKVQAFADVNVNFREEAKKDSKKLSLIEKNSNFEIIGQEENGWFKIIYDGQVGYVDSSFVTFNTENEYRKDFTKVVYATNQTELRKEANESSSLYSISENEICEVLGEMENEYFVRCAGRLGYVSKSEVNDLSCKFIAIDISAQKLTLYSNNSILLETDIVTGKKGEYDTPTGMFEIKKKETDTFLSGEDYLAHVNYWMPINGGIGLHDASWRKRFGDSIYVNNGSHGCINIPPEYTDDIYESVEKGTKVLVHK